MLDRLAQIDHRLVPCHLRTAKADTNGGISPRRLPRVFPVGRNGARRRCSARKGEEQAQPRVAVKVDPPTLPQIFIQIQCRFTFVSAHSSLSLDIRARADSRAASRALMSASAQSRFRSSSLTSDLFACKSSSRWRRSSRCLARSTLFPGAGKGLGSVE